MNKIQVLEKEAVTVEKKVIKEIDVKFPTKARFYKMEDNSNWFPRGTVLFAITVKYTNTFLLFEIERGKQFYTDFMPNKDCKRDYWLTDTNNIRRTALKLMQEDLGDFIEIEKEEFLRVRRELLDEALTETI